MSHVVLVVSDGEGGFWCERNSELYLDRNLGVPYVTWRSPERGRDALAER